MAQRNERRLLMPEHGPRSMVRAVTGSRAWAFSGGGGRWARPVRMLETAAGWLAFDGGRQPGRPVPVCTVSHGLLESHDETRIC